MSDTALFLFLMIPGTVFLGVSDVLVRRVLRGGKSSSQQLVMYECGATAFLLAIPLFIFGIPEIRAGFWSAVAVTVILNTFAQWAWYSAFAREEASLISPIRLLTPPFVILTGYLVLKETPSLWGALGIMITVIGLWILLRDEARNTRFTVREVLRRPGMLLALWGALSFAISFPFDKKAVVASSPLFAIVVVFTGLALGSALVLFVRREKGTHLSFRANRKVFLMIPFVHAAASLLTYAAMQYSLAAYAASVKRLWPLWTILLSGAFLKEGNIAKKVVATGIMLAGIALTVILG